MSGHNYWRVHHGRSMLKKTKETTDYTFANEKKFHWKLTWVIFLKKIIYSAKVLSALRNCMNEQVKIWWCSEFEWLSIDESIYKGGRCCSFSLPTVEALSLCEYIWIMKTSSLFWNKSMNWCLSLTKINQSCSICDGIYKTKTVLQLLTVFQRSLLNKHHSMVICVWTLRGEIVSHLMDFSWNSSFFEN